MNPSEILGGAQRPQGPTAEIEKYVLGKVWQTSPLGEVKGWPQSLKLAVNLCLNSHLPVAVWWSRELLIIYNDALRRILDLKHPDALGSRGADVLSGDLWYNLEQSLNAVLEKGESTDLEDYIVNFQNGDTERNRATFYNVPIFDENGKVSGVFTTMVDSETVQLTEGNGKKIKEDEDTLQLVIESTDLGIWEYYPPRGEFKWSQKCSEIYKVPEGTDVDFKTFLEHIHPEDRASVESQIARATDPVGKGNFNIVYRIVAFVGRDIRWIRSHGKVHFNFEGAVKRFMGTVQDVTEEMEYELKRKEDELKMELTMQASAMGSFEWNILTSDFKYSDRVAEIFGYPAGLVLKQTDFVERIHPDDRQIRLKAHETAFQTGNLFYEVRIVWSDGSIHWVSLSGHTIFDKAGKPECMYGTVLDITDSRTKADALELKVRERTNLLERTNEELKKSQELYTKMTEEVQDYAIILLDVDGTILNWNKGAQNIKGYTENEIVGQNFSLFYLEEDRKSNLPEKLIRMAGEEGRAMHEGLRKRKDGTTFWGSIVITALHDDNNKVIGFTKVTRDLTERKMAEDKVRQHAAELEVKNRQLEQFAYIASHDLQEPLRKIQTFVEILEKKIDNEDVRNRYYTKINTSAKRMGQLIQSVLNYSRLSQTRELLLPTDLNIILENVLADYELLIEEKKAVIRYDRMPTIQGIELLLGQLFSNLIGNALKFSETEPLISISCRIVNGQELKKLMPAEDPSGNYLELTFKDNGIGFEQQYSEKIFNIFQRLNSQDDYAGTGIGLALCKKIVEHHHGYIYARSELGRGASFFVYLPST